jgi:hypothetical protein
MLDGLWAVAIAGPIPETREKLRLPETVCQLLSACRPWLLFSLCCTTDATCAPRR